MSKDKWHIEKVMFNIMRGQNSKLTTKPDFNTIGATINQEKLSTCLTTLVHIIKNDGEQYLPIFEHLQKELNEYRRLLAIKEITINMAEQDEKENQALQPKA